MKKDLAVRVVQGLARVRERAQENPKATASYWNGDSWGSISGHRDAREWVEEQEAKYLRRMAKATPKRKGGST